MAKHYYITLSGRRTTLRSDFPNLESAKSWLIDYVIELHGSAKLDWHVVEGGTKLTSPNFKETYLISTVVPALLHKEISHAKAQNPL